MMIKKYISGMAWMTCAVLGLVLAAYAMAAGPERDGTSSKDNSALSPDSLADEKSTPTIYSEHGVASCSAADVNCDENVNVDDLLLVIGAWGKSYPPSDVNEDSNINVDDLLLVINNWGPCTAVSVTVPMRWVEGPRAGEIIPDSWQNTLACNSGASMDIITTGLIPGHAYTLWFVFFNHPENCMFPTTEGMRCGFADVFNTATDANFVYGDGLVASGVNDYFSAFVGRGVPPEGTLTCNGVTCAGEKVALAFEDDDTAILTDPLTAEYQSVLRNHGPEDENYMPEQIKTHMGGCEPDDPYHPCRDDQTSGARSDIPLECNEDPSCAAGLLLTEYPFIVGSGSGIVPNDDDPTLEDRAYFSISVKEQDGVRSGHCEFIHYRYSGEVLAQFEGNIIECVSVSGRIAHITWRITSGSSSTFPDLSGELVSFVVHDNGPSGDICELNAEFLSGTPIVDPDPENNICATGGVPVALDQGNFIVVDN